MIVMLPPFYTRRLVMDRLRHRCIRRPYSGGHSVGFLGLARLLPLPRLGGEPLAAQATLNNRTGFRPGAEQPTPHTLRLARLARDWADWSHL